MSWLYGALNLSDSTRDTVNTVGQRVVWDAAQAYLDQYNQNLMEMTSVFVQEETEDHSFRYQLPGGGMAQQRGGQARSHDVKGAGEWKVELPLYEFGDAVGGDKVAMAYMTLQAFQAHIDTVRLRDLARVRYEILRSLLNNNTRTFPDPRKGDLSVKPLANGDSDLYPPVRGSSAEATANYYAGLNNAAIDDTHNPFAIAVGKLTLRFGSEQGNSNILSFINPQETPATENLEGFVEVTDRFVIPGLNTDTLTGVPQCPGRIIGRVSGSWVSEWPDMPAGYTLTLHLAAPKPLLRRVDPAFTGLPRGLNLVAQADGNHTYPFENAYWAHRYGYGVGNRLNGYVQQVVASASYTVPTGL